MPLRPSLAFLHAGNDHFWHGGLANRIAPIIFKNSSQQRLNEGQSADINAFLVEKPLWRAACLAIQSGLSHKACSCQDTVANSSMLAASGSNPTIRSTQCDLDDHHIPWFKIRIDPA